MLLRSSQRAKSWENVFSTTENGNYEKKRVNKVNSSEGNHTRYDDIIAAPPFVVTATNNIGNSQYNTITTKVRLLLITLRYHIYKALFTMNVVLFNLQ